MDLSGSNINTALYDFFRFITAEAAIEPAEAAAAEAVDWFSQNVVVVNDGRVAVMTRTNADIILEMENTLNRFFSAGAGAEATAILSNSLFQDKAKYKNILSAEGELEQLEYIEYRAETGHNSSCPIMQIDFTENQPLIKLPCKHCFDPAAIKHWLKKEKAECPVCRFELKSVEESNEPEPETVEPLLNTIPPPHNRRLQQRRLQQRRPELAQIENILFRAQEEAEENDIQQAIIASFVYM
jgi:hypothetical protein